MLGELKEEGFVGACPREHSEHLPGEFSGIAKEHTFLTLGQNELWECQGSSVLLKPDPRDTNVEEPTEGGRDPDSDRSLGCPLKQKFNRQVQLGQECGHDLKLKKDTSISYEPSECKISFHCEKQLATYLRTHSGWESFSASELEDSLRRRPQLKTQSKMTEQHQCEACMRNFSCKVSLVTHQHCHCRRAPVVAIVSRRGSCPTNWFLCPAVCPGGKLSSLICGYCDKSFSCLSDLVQHPCIHTSKQPYSCAKCERSCVQKHHLREHQKIQWQECSRLVLEPGRVL